MVILAGLDVVSRDFSGKFRSAGDRVIHKISVRSQMSVWQVVVKHVRTYHVCLEFCEAIEPIP